ncbi:hypothetical protein CCACVL1_14057 [Corchorus capsularis]|uniref:Uncharacterized protein n=1 Tax=Corchorus capsularis TaxID=210143 RepID=A0A1R3I8H3_COCAP|nr:hypothetical protein CCACVL1_14057 [Corchorus capsularis]
MAAFGYSSNDGRDDPMDHVYGGRGP